MTVTLNDREICTSKAEYGTAYEAPKLESTPSTTPANQPPASAAPPSGGMEAMHGHGAILPTKNATVIENKGGKATTISKMSDCLTTFPVKAGDKMKLRAHYDLNAHPRKCTCTIVIL
jgi:hypothetical protein